MLLLLLCLTYSLCSEYILQGEVRSSRLDEVKSGQVRLDKVQAGQVKLNEVRSGQVGYMR
jgi:hypothetical protein